MDQEGIGQLLTYYQEELERLAPTLNPGKNLPYTKIGLLNTARRKEKKYQHNFKILRMAQLGGKEYPDEFIKELLE